MSLNECPECGRKKKLGQSYKHIYRCQKCGQLGCVSRSISMSRIDGESCWPKDSQCPAGGHHIRVQIDSIYSLSIA